MTTRALKVVLADDVRLELEIEKTFLQRSGFKVLTATDGLAALALASSERPDLVILDQVMPGLTGTEICARLRAAPDTHDIPVLITSAHDNPDLRTACKAAGVSGFVPKSVGREDLLKVIARILHVPERKAVRITVFFSVLGATGSRETLGKAVDLAESGMGLETNRRYETGSTLKMRFLLPGDRMEFKVEAKVRRVIQRNLGTYELGVEFTGIPESDRIRLNEYVDRSLSSR